MFLRKAGTHYVVVEPQVGIFPLSRITTQPSAPKPGMDLLEADLTAGVSDSDHRSVEWNLLLLLGFRHLKSTPEVVDVLKLGDPGINAIAFSVLLTNGDFSYGQQLLDFVEHIPQKSTFSFDLGPLMSGIAKILDSAQVPLLLKLLRAKNVFFRRSAIDALRAIRSSDAVPALVERLNDPDFQVRLTAVDSLVEITGQRGPDLSPSVPDFEKSEDRYIKAWKDWWRESGNSLYTPPAQQ